MGTLVRGARPTVKFADGSADVLDICAVPFVGPIPAEDGQGRDLDGEFFSPRTDLCLDWFPESRPLLYDHGLNAKTGPAVVGRVDSTTLRKAVDGYWVRAQLDRASEYYDSLKQLIEQAVLAASSGALGYLVKTAKTGEILRWPWVELSLTPTPSNVYARVQPAEATKHYAAIGSALTLPAAELKRAWDAAYINDLPDASFAVILPGGKKDADGKTVPRSLRKLPHHTADGAVDPSHLRNALARLPQSDLSGDARAKAESHLERHAKAAGVGDRGGKRMKVRVRKQADGSFEDVQNRIGLALQRAGLYGCYVIATYPDRVIVSQTTDDDTEYYAIPYTIAADDDSLTLGTPVEVEMIFTPSPDADDTGIFGGMEMGGGGMVGKARIKALADRIRRANAVLDRALAAKASRVLSADNLKDIKAASERLDSVMQRHSAAMDKPRS